MLLVGLGILQHSLPEASDADDNTGCKSESSADCKDSGPGQEGHVQAHQSGILSTQLSCLHFQPLGLCFQILVEYF